jgi:AraC-like DNA-binding protein
MSQSDTIVLTRPELVTLLEYASDRAIEKYKRVVEENEKLYSREELCKKLGYKSPSSFYRAVDAKKIKVRRVGKKYALITNP